MAWAVKLKSVIDNAAQFDSIQLEFQYYNKVGHQNFEERYPFSVEDDFEVIRERVLAKLAILNTFRAKVEELKELIGKVLEPARAVSLGLKAGSPVLKEPTRATILGLEASPPVPK